MINPSTSLRANNLNNADLSDLIHIKFRQKKEVVHSTRVANDCNFKGKIVANGNRVEFAGL